MYEKLLFIQRKFCGRHNGKFDLFIFTYLKKTFVQNLFQFFKQLSLSLFDFVIFYFFTFIKEMEIVLSETKHLYHTKISLPLLLSFLTDLFIP